MKGMPEKYRNSLKPASETEVDIEDDLLGEGGRSYEVQK